MKCLWCARETTAEKALVSDEVVYANLEHIFPESVGGKHCLEQGKVCEDCNNRLGLRVDRHLRDNNTMMKIHWQNGSLVAGKPIGKKGRNKQDKERKEAMMTNTTAFDGGTKIQRDEEQTNRFTLTNVAGGLGSELFDEKFCRALHKCAVNILYDASDYEAMHAQFASIIEFVNSDTCDASVWPYGIFYANTFAYALIEPQYFVLKSGGTPLTIVMIFPALIAVVGLQPNLLQPANLDEIGSRVMADVLIHLGQNAERFQQHFDGGGVACLSRELRTFGSVFGFQFHKKLRAPQPCPSGDFHVLFHCDVCGQINPSTIVVDKRKILASPRLGHNKCSRSEGWNIITADDLRNQGLDVETWSPDILEGVLKQPFTFSSDCEFVNFDKIHNCSQNCINCGMLVTYSGEDLFI